MTVSTLIICALCLIISIIVSYLVIQWAHEIKNRNHALSTQTRLLSLIAERQGVPQKDIEKLLSKDPEPNPTHVNLYIILLLLVVVLAIIIAKSLEH